MVLKMTWYWKRYRGEIQELTQVWIVSMRKVTKADLLSLKKICQLGEVIDRSIKLQTACWRIGFSLTLSLPELCSVKRGKRTRFKANVRSFITSAGGTKGTKHAEIKMHLCPIRMLPQHKQSTCICNASHCCCSFYYARSFLLPTFRCVTVHLDLSNVQDNSASIPCIPAEGQTLSSPPAAESASKAFWETWCIYTFQHESSVCIVSIMKWILKNCPKINTGQKLIQDYGSRRQQTSGAGGYIVTFRSSFPSRPAHALLLLWPSGTAPHIPQALTRAVC